MYACVQAMPYTHIFYLSVSALAMPIRRKVLSCIPLVSLFSCTLHAKRIGLRCVSTAQMLACKFGLV